MGGLTGSGGFRSEIRKHYQRLAPFYPVAEPFLCPLKRGIAEALKVVAGPVLDVACGRGTQLEIIAGPGRYAVGIDLSRAMLRRAKVGPAEGNPFGLVEGDGARLPFRDGAFAASLVTLALHEMPPDVAVAVLREMKRVVQPGGLIVVADFRESLPWIVKAGLGIIEPRHFGTYLGRGLNRYLREAGLDPRTLSLHLFGTVALTVSCKS